MCVRGVWAPRDHTPTAPYCWCHQRAPTWQYRAIYNVTRRLRLLTANHWRCTGTNKPEALATSRHNQRTKKCETDERGTMWVVEQYV